jgi:fused signal recognition particle receptor
MILGDIGVQATDRLMTQLRGEVKERHITEPAQCRELLISDIREKMTVDGHAYDSRTGLPLCS